MEFTKKPLELRIYGKEVTLNKPSYGQILNWRKKMKDESLDQIELAGQTLLECGMPEDLLQELEAEHITEISMLLSGAKKN